MADFMENVSHEIINYIGPTDYWNYRLSVGFDLMFNFTGFELSSVFSIKC